MAEYIEREEIFRAYMDLCTTKSKLAKARKGAAFFQSDLLPETELTEKEWVRLVNAVPAADVAPVVHGRWVEKEEPYFDVIFACSACGEEFCFIEGNPSDNLYKYCPNCGARMDGE